VHVDLFLRIVTMQGSGALKRMMMLDFQRLENETLLQLPRLNTVQTILQVFGEQKLPQVLASCACSVLGLTIICSSLKANTAT
jgi:hypothetical protein